MADAWDGTADTIGDVTAPTRHIDASGTAHWTADGVEHRDDGPAYEGSDGTTIWYRNGLVHRDGGPAYDNPASGLREWFCDGQWHRLDGPAREDDTNGTVEWYVWDREIIGGDVALFDAVPIGDRELVAVVYSGSLGMDAAIGAACRLR